MPLPNVCQLYMLNTECHCGAEVTGYRLMVTYVEAPTTNERAPRPKNYDLDRVAASLEVSYPLSTALHPRVCPLAFLRSTAGRSTRCPVEKGRGCYKPRSTQDSDYESRANYPGSAEGQSLR